MSGWVVAAREIYDAGGSKPAGHVWSPSWAVAKARQQGLLEPCLCLGSTRHHATVAITPLGRQLFEGKAEFYTPRISSTNGGRAAGTHRRLRATWLAALPTGVRLTANEHPAQNDGSCYW